MLEIERSVLLISVQRLLQGPDSTGVIAQMLDLRIGRKGIPRPLEKVERGRKRRLKTRFERSFPLIGCLEIFGRSYKVQVVSIDVRLRPSPFGPLRTQYHRCCLMRFPNVLLTRSRSQLTVKETQLEVCRFGPMVSFACSVKGPKRYLEESFIEVRSVSIPHANIYDFQLHNIEGYRGRI